MVHDLLNKIESNFRYFIDHFFLLSEENSDFYSHYYRSAQLASIIGEHTDEFHSAHRNKILFDATLYCDIGLDKDLKLGRSLLPEDRDTALKKHIDVSMEILRGGEHFFKHAILLIAWHHWQPDSNGYTPRELPALELYKNGGAIISLTTAFDAIFSRNFKKYHDLSYSLIVATAIVLKNKNTQFIENNCNILLDCLKHGFPVYYNSSQIIVKIDETMFETVQLFLRDGVYRYEDYLNSKENRPKKTSSSLTTSADDITRFEQHFKRGINGDLYNINEITEYLHVLLVILDKFPEKFELLFIKILEFIAQFHYPDGEIKSFVKIHVYKNIEEIFNVKPGNIESFFIAIINVWVSYIQNGLDVTLLNYFEKNILNYLDILRNIKATYSFSNRYMTPEIEKATRDKEALYLQHVKQVYNAREIDQLNQRISWLKLFRKIWT